MCCVLVLTIYKLGGATASVDYQLDPITKSKIETPLSINVVLVLVPPPESSALPEDHIDVTFTVKSLNEAALTITPSDKLVTASVESGNNDISVYHGKFEVFVTTHTDGVLTGDLSAKLSCNHKLCKGKDQAKVIVKETKSECVH